MIYLDHHSATKPCSSALERMNPYFDEHFAASFAPHNLGVALVDSLESRYQMIFDFLEAERDDQFVFTSSGAEAVNQIFWSVFLKLAREEGKCHIIISTLEDIATIECAKRFEELGCTVKIVPENERGVIDLEVLESLISPRTALISVSMAHGLTGVIQPVKELIELARKKQVLLHLDATYAIGKYLIAFESDYLTFSGDRIHSVKGSGALFAKKNAPLAPLILGGCEQNGLRGGSFDIPSFMALSAAVQQAELYLDIMTLEITRLRDLFESLVPSQVLFKDELRLPNVSLLSFEKVHREALLYYLNRKGLYATFYGSYDPEQLNIPETALSFAMSRMTTEEEVRKAALIVNETVKNLQTIAEGI